MNQCISYRAKWIYTADSRLIENAYLTIAGNSIQHISKNQPDGWIIDHDGILLPGLVNTHTHLEFSDLEKPLGEPGNDFINWVARVINYRRERAAESRGHAITLGLKESLVAGTSALGEISTFDWVIPESEELQVNHLEIVDFRELIGFWPDQHPEIVTHIDRFCGHLIEGKQIRGLSPHAPYSINQKSLEYSVEISKQNKLPLAMHLAETQQEIELLSDHRGPFRDLLDRMGLWTSDNFAKHTTPLDFLQLLLKAYRALVIHGNYLSDDELGFIAKHRDVLKLVYCPRTHAYFQHTPYPLETVLKLKIPLALGTDSRASNPDLSLWNEMEYLFTLGLLHPFEIIDMGTKNGAHALGLEKRLGALAPGFKASLFLAPSPRESDFSKAIVQECSPS